MRGLRSLGIEWGLREFGREMVGVGTLCGRIG